MRDHAGFSLVELLLAALITLVVLGGAFQLAAPAQRIFQAQPEASDVQQRMRVAMEALRADLIMAGAGTYAGPALGPLNDMLAPVMPYRAFGDTPDQARGVFYRADAISFLYVPATPSQTTLAVPLDPGSLDPLVESPSNCPLETPQQACGFGAGDRLLVADGSSNWDLYTVDRVLNGVMSLRHRGEPSSTRYLAGAPVAEIHAGTYYLKTDLSAGTFQLMRHDGWATESPVADEVVGLEFRYFGAALPPELTGAPIGMEPGPWTTYGPPRDPCARTRDACARRPLARRAHAGISH
jgi:type II secretory pathway pseudopilin PulG